MQAGFLPCLDLLTHGGVHTLGVSRVLHNGAHGGAALQVPAEADTLSQLLPLRVCLCSCLVSLAAHGGTPMTFLNAIQMTCLDVCEVVQRSKPSSVYKHDEDTMTLLKHMLGQGQQRLLLQCGTSSSCTAHQGGAFLLAAGAQQGRLPVSRRSAQAARTPGGLHCADCASNSLRR